MMSNHTKNERKDQEEPDTFIRRSLIVENLKKTESSHYNRILYT